MNYPIEALNARAILAQRCNLAFGIRLVESGWYPVEINVHDRCYFFPMRLKKNFLLLLIYSVSLLAMRVSEDTIRRKVGSRKKEVLIGNYMKRIYRLGIILCEWVTRITHETILFLFDRIHCSNYLLILFSARPMNYNSRNETGRSRTSIPRDRRYYYSHLLKRYTVRLAFDIKRRVRVAILLLTICRGSPPSFPSNLNRDLATESRFHTRARGWRWSKNRGDDRYFEKLFLLHVTRVVIWSRWKLSLWRICNCTGESIAHVSRGEIFF